MIGVDKFIILFSARPQPVKYQQIHKCAGKKNSKTNNSSNSSTTPLYQQ